MSLLDQFASLKSKQELRKVDSSRFQPTLAQQKDLIVKNFAKRLISNIIKKESRKFIFDEGRRGKPLASTGESKKFGERPHTTPNFGSNNLGYSWRPSTADSGSAKSDFVAALRKDVSAADLASGLDFQREHQLKDSKRVFDAICTHSKLGVLCQFTTKSHLEKVDVSHFAAQSGAHTPMRLDDFQKKKEGIALWFDPATNTNSMKITFQILYKKQIDINTEEDASKEVTIWSNGNYYSLRLMMEYNRHTSEVNYNPRINVSMATAVNFEDSMQAAQAAGYEIDNNLLCSLPGWNHRPPVFIPATKCQIRVLHEEFDPQVASATAFNLSKLRIYAVSATSIRNGIKRVNEFCEHHSLSQVANLMIPGGISALNLAALHGNLEGVRRLVDSGADVNHRCKESRNNTPLHEAVIGGHAEVVKFLLEHNASQLLKDDSGWVPLHHACKTANITIARLLITHMQGKRALLQVDNNDQKPIDKCSSQYMKIRVEGAMRQFKIFMKPRVSLMERL